MTLLVFRGCLGEPGGGKLPLKLLRDHALPPTRYAASAAPIRSCEPLYSKFSRSKVDNPPVKFLDKGCVLNRRGSVVSKIANVGMIAKPFPTVSVLIQELMQQTFLHLRSRMNCQNLNGKRTRALNCGNTNVGLLRSEADFDELLASDEVDEAAH